MVCDSLHGVLLPTWEAHLSLVVQSFYWGLIMQACLLPAWLTFVSIPSRGRAYTAWPSAPIINHIVSINYAVSMNQHKPKAPEKQRHSYQAEQSSGQEITSHWLRAKVRPLLGQGSSFTAYMFLHVYWLVSKFLGFLDTFLLQRSSLILLWPGNMLE